MEVRRRTFAVKLIFKVAAKTWLGLATALERSNDRKLSRDVSFRQSAFNAPRMLKLGSKLPQFQAPTISDEITSVQLSRRQNTGSETQCALSSPSLDALTGPYRRLRFSCLFSRRTRGPSRCTKSVTLRDCFESSNGRVKAFLTHTVHFLS